MHGKEWCWSWSSNTLATWCKGPLHWKRLWCWERLKAQGEGVTEDEMVGRHHRSNGHEFEQILGDSEGQGSLAFCSPWGRKESDMTWLLNKGQCIGYPLLLKKLHQIKQLKTTNIYYIAWFWKVRNTETSSSSGQSLATRLLSRAVTISKLNRSF